MIQWQFTEFNTLSAFDFYEIAKLRQGVFIVEQNCVYQDIDELDLSALHLIAWDMTASKKILISYCRIIKPQDNQDYFTIGRVLSNKQYRRRGYAKALMKKAITQIEQTQLNKNIHISAQLYLKEFYESLGFYARGKAYDEDGIQHVSMIKPYSI